MSVKKIWYRAQCCPLCLAEVLLIKNQETAASYLPQPTGVLVRRICDVNAELHLLTRSVNLNKSTKYLLQKLIFYYLNYSLQNSHKIHPQA